jgi:outer membrane protein
MQKKIFLMLAFVLSIFKLYAKEKSPAPLKIGYADVEYILGFLPESKTIESEYASFEKQLQKQLEPRIREFQQKVKAFQQGQEAMTEAVRNKKTLELQQLQGTLEQLQLGVQENLTSKRISLIKPIYDKIAHATKQVAKRSGYTHVLNASVGDFSILLYADESDNISDRVLKELGIDPVKAKNKK